MTQLQTELTLITVLSIIMFIFGLTMGLRYESNKVQDIIDQCELELPRNQHCVITAIPMENNQ